MTRLTTRFSVVVWEEAEIGRAALPSLRFQTRAGNIRVVTPQLPGGLDDEASRTTLTRLLDEFLAGEPPVGVRWYYTPMMLAFSRGLSAACTVYDCMNEPSALRRRICCNWKASCWR